MMNYSRARYVDWGLFRVQHEGQRALSLQQLFIPLCLDISCMRVLRCLSLRIQYEHRDRLRRQHNIAPQTSTDLISCSTWYTAKEDNHLHANRFTLDRCSTNHVLCSMNNKQYRYTSLLETRIIGLWLVFLISPLTGNKSQATRVRKNLNKEDLILLHLWRIRSRLTDRLQGMATQHANEKCVKTSLAKFRLGAL